MKYFIGILDQTNAELIQRWNNPHPHFAAGTDQRSSDKSLLENLYGGMERAARYDWLNGGRTLIDKTYLKMLWTACGLPAPTLGYEKLAANLDNFIRNHLSEMWDELNDWSHEQRTQFAVELVDEASKQLFGSQPNLSFASQLLLYLCPQLPIFPFSERLDQAVQQFYPDQCFSEARKEINYGDYHKVCREVMANNLPALAAQSTPVATSTEINLTTLLAQTDWWIRRLMCQQLTKLAAEPLAQPDGSSVQDYLKSA